jgi:hypothetical protein
MTLVENWESGIVLSQPDQIALLTYAYWLQNIAGNVQRRSRRTEQELETALNGWGFFAYLDSNNYPQLQHWYNGPIQVGDFFIWEPTKPHTREFVQVMKIIRKEESKATEDRIVTRSLSANQKLTTEFPWNDESRFREACIRVTDTRIFFKDEEPSFVHSQST